MTRLRALLACGLALGASSSGAAGVAGGGSRVGLTFTREHDERYSVWVANADGSAARRIVTRAQAGTLSPDGRWLAYSRQPRSFNSDRVPLYVVKLFGGKPRRIGEGRGAQWSPDGSKLAIVGDAGLLLIDLASGRRRELVRSRDLLQVAFSPDGRAIAYARGNGRAAGAFRADIFAVRLADGAVTRLTHDGHSMAPLWGPRWIVYERLRWRGGIATMGRLWLMRPDGSGKRFFARGAEGLLHRFPVFGLDPVALSADGRRLLACQAFEFGCPRVTFTVPGGKRYGFPELRPLERKRGATPVDLSRDGARVLVDVGSPHDNRHHDIYEVPFAGGELRLLVRDAIDASFPR